MVGSLRCTKLTGNRAVNNLNLRGVNSIKINIDPFVFNNGIYRTFYNYLNRPKIMGTNKACTLTMDLHTNQAPSTLTATFVDGSTKIFDSPDLNFKSLLRLFSEAAMEKDPRLPEVIEKLYKKPGKFPNKSAGSGAGAAKGGKATPKK